MANRHQVPQRQGRGSTGGPSLHQQHLLVSVKYTGGHAVEKCTGRNLLAVGGSAIPGDRVLSGPARLCRLA